MGPCHHGMAGSQVVGEVYSLQIMRTTVNIVNKEPQTAEKG